jgi:hypothetical protein
MTSTRGPTDRCQLDEPTLRRFYPFIKSAQQISQSIVLSQGVDAAMMPVGPAQPAARQDAR